MAGYSAVTPPEQELKKECIFNEPFDREIRQVFLHGTICLSISLRSETVFRLSRFLNKYTVRNKLTSKVSETDLHPNDRKFPRNESLDQWPPAYHDNRSAENQNHCLVQNGKPENVVYFAETRP